ncbi:MAG: cytochrome B6 [Elusimicrobia bacterium]|nr:cytochrome B6 [Elusimicrobiota bacterium]
MKRANLPALAMCVMAIAWAAPAPAAEDPTTPQSFPSFEAMKEWFSARRGEVDKRQENLLNERYDLSDRPAQDARMSNGKPIQEGVRVRLPPGVTWNDLSKMSPDEIRSKNVFPIGFMPLPHPNQPEGGMLFPKSNIDLVKKQDGRDLERFDLDFDIPERFLPGFPPAMYLTTHPELGDVSHGKLVTLDNYYALFKDILNMKQLDGLRLLVTPFPQQQFNSTDDRRVARPSLGVTCFDCHANGGTNAATHLVGDIRPQEERHRIETPALRGVNIQRLFGSQRALKSIEDFTEFEQSAAYFDGDISLAAKKGVNVLDRTSQVHHMAEFEELLDFPPAPKLEIDGELDPKKATAAERRGQALFFGKAKCATCHAPPYYTDNSMHDLKVDRFFKPRMINGMLAQGDGAIKTFPLRGIKDTPPYLHDGRLLTLDDSVEFFNIVLQTKLTTREKKDVVEFMKAL